MKDRHHLIFSRHWLLWPLFTQDERRKSSDAFHTARLAQHHLAALWHKSQLHFNSLIKQQLKIPWEAWYLKYRVDDLCLCMFMSLTQKICCCLLLWTFQFFFFKEEIFLLGKHSFLCLIWLYLRLRGCIWFYLGSLIEKTYFTDLSP